MVGGSLKLLLRVSIWEFGAWVDSDRDALRVGMGPTAVVLMQLSAKEVHKCLVVSK